MDGPGLENARDHTADPQLEDGPPRSMGERTQTLGPAIRRWLQWPPECRRSARPPKPKPKIKLRNKCKQLIGWRMPPSNYMPKNRSNQPKTSNIMLRFLLRSTLSRTSNKRSNMSCSRTSQPQTAKSEGIQVRSTPVRTKNKNATCLVPVPRRPSPST